MNIFETPIGRYAPGIVNVVVEIPKGSRKRYRYHRKRRMFVVDYRLMTAAPGEYGWVPQTWTRGGKRINALVLVRKPTWGGNICEVRPIGALKRRDGDHQLICVLLGEPRFEAVRDIRDLDAGTMRRLAQFYEPFFPLAGWMNRAEAQRFLLESYGSFQNRARRREPLDETDEEEDEFPAEFEGEELDDVSVDETQRRAESPLPPVTNVERTPDSAIVEDSSESIVPRETEEHEV